MYVYVHCTYGDTGVIIYILREDPLHNTSEPKGSNLSLISLIVQSSMLRNSQYVAKFN